MLCGKESQVALLMRRPGNRLRNSDDGGPVVDFSAMLSSDDESDPIEPRELHSQLKKAPGYGYLRDVQGQVLTAWHLLTGIDASG